jgi:hypothetical protein
LKKISVPSGAKGKIELVKEIKEVGVRLRWRFKLQDNDIAFGVVFTEAGKPDDAFVRPDRLPLRVTVLTPHTHTHTHRKRYSPCAVTPTTRN